MRYLKDSELRIGNLVFDSTGNTTKVESIIPEHNRIRYGIPINEKRLLNFGFEYKKTALSNNYKLKEFRITYVIEGKLKGKKYLVYANKIQMNNFGHIKYIHELQNFYYQLTGTELIIK
jgi:hypothetical protein